MVSELIRFNCHILGNNKHQDNITPTILLEKYKADSAGKPFDLIIDGIKLEVVSVNWAANSKSSILTKVKRID